MITKISKLKNFGIFHDFSWDSTNTPEFKKYNLIYGWNRSGKTTFSRVFASCEKKSVYEKDKFPQYPKDGEFEIKTNNGIKIKNSDVSNNNTPTKVFNQDFIDNNIFFNNQTSCNPIVYISEEDISSKKLLEELKNNKDILDKKYYDSSKDRIAKEEVKNVFLKGLGITISNIIFDKTYNKTKAEYKIYEIGIDNFKDKILSTEDKKKYEEVSKSHAGKYIYVFSKFNINFIFNNQNIDSFEKLIKLIKELLDKKVIVETLKRLENDSVLNDWVKNGFDLYKTKNDKKCPFCEKQLDGDFLNVLSKHFSKDYEDFQKKIIELKTEIIKIKKEKIDEKNDEFYPDLRKDYETKAKELNGVIEKLNTWIDSVVLKLEEKYKNPLIVVKSDNKPEDLLIAHNNIISKLNIIVTSHNDKIKNYTTEVKNAREKLELDSIAISISKQNFKKMEETLKEAKKKEEENLENTNENNEKISDLENKNSNISEAIEEINIYLKDFFGEEEIKLGLSTDKKGYLIKRYKNIANNLSEGEKTAIAFSYFIAKTKEQEFKINNGIFFIDDPISSFDSNFIYHAFSLIKNNLNEVNQLFISTHNFQFFNLIKNWFIKKNNNAKILNKDFPCEFYMIKNNPTSTYPRNSMITLLDDTLKNNKSEYSFLFSILDKFNKNPNPNCEDMYNISNIGRRFFDIFADFKIPSNSKEETEKLDMIVKEINKTKKPKDKITKSSCERVLWLLNEFSHNSDPTSSLEHKDKSESREAVKILLNIIKESDPKHYQILEEESSN